LSPAHTRATAIPKGKSMSTPRLVPVLLAALGLAVAGCQQKPAEPKARTDDQQAIYAFGLAAGRQMATQTDQLRLTPEEKTAFQDGLTDALAGKQADFDVAAFEEKFRTLAEARVAAGAEESRKKGEELLAKAAAEPEAVRTDSGMVFRSVTAGTGASPAATDTVRVHYVGTLADGKVFDSSRDRGEPAEFALNQVIPCWTEGVQRMKVGGTAKLACPANLAYGERAAGSIPPNSTLFFEVELLDIVKAAKAP
jgi:FKBP-type peptidyl-prolyl cis-trans isomerase FkpA